MKLHPLPSSAVLLALSLSCEHKHSNPAHESETAHGARALAHAQGDPGAQPEHRDHAHVKHAAQPEHRDHAHAKHTAQPEQSAHPHPPPSGSQLALNDGQKWRADESTKNAMAKMTAELEGAPPETLAAYRALGVELQGQLRGLIAGCKMQGPAHDQLHTWLGKFMPAVSTLASAKSLQGAARQTGTVRTLLSEYSAHFE